MSESNLIVVTGATGKLGRHVVNQLLEKVPANRIVAAVRNPEKAAEFAAKGVQVRLADYTKPSTLDTAFKGAEKILLISSSEIGQRAVQHQAVIDAAKRANVKLLAYTSILHADASRIVLALEHQETETALKASGIPFVLLRNGWYTENYTESLQPVIQHGVLAGSSGTGKIAAAARADYAAAAVTVLTTSGHENKVYELAGDTSFTKAELAAEVAKQTGKPVTHKELPLKEYTDLLVSFGLPGVIAGALADSDVGIARGELNDSSGDLRKLIGRPTTPIAKAVSAALS